MPLDVVLVDPGTGVNSKIDRFGNFTVSPPVSASFNATLEVDNTTVNIVPARAGENFCITGFVLTGNKSIDPNTDAVVTLFEAKDGTTGTSERDILIIPVARSASVTVTGIILSGGLARYINGKTTDDDVLVTLFGFYVTPKIDLITA